MSQNTYTETFEERKNECDNETDKFRKTMSSHCFSVILTRYC